MVSDIILTLTLIEIHVLGRLFEVYLKGYIGDMNGMYGDSNTKIFMSEISLNDHKGLIYLYLTIFSHTLFWSVLQIIHGISIIF